jgi:hypothetical protein
MAASLGHVGIARMQASHRTLLRPVRKLSAENATNRQEVGKNAVISRRMSPLIAENRRP